ncbi:hypothetical protein A2303_05410 [Candidatus Falkowbacteria bacterium RIFOXYB2_FULL_47_14]|uniref:Uncharacterized protein n=1 Tax=Candidatus Falkowbacteria bacterium RIFOXYA2_FULL_47_19 TaxID=1797994 RepID=A0A1F5SL21_9BACT|nr:MAG: hypothetical protein A2227_02130 [Candidatus Falkowbacteria bacterium RIFOXYA2_FULL_47_19]OGF36907.1 MAG: hypothetical protein A2468_08065 [Candidatus Falkowbacteria bacterium RIFOXYC2_FULL_46_15]OGF43288.1 MAG: hypothetical protein A2303_05410 [Candidatus Falkowbacteria bacterium RIFOXYB2_FULL_47_14]
MPKKTILSIGLALLSLSLILYLTFSLKRVTVRSGSEGRTEIQNTAVTEKVDLKKLEAGYKTQVKFVIIDYEALIGTTTEPADGTADKIMELRNKLTDLSVPTELKNLHLDLVLAFSRMENYFRGGSQEEKDFSDDLLERAKNDHEWLTMP